MRALVQRVSHASVTVEGNVSGAISTGLLVFIGIAREDTEHDRDFVARKLLGLRIFEDEAGRMNRSVRDVNGAILLVSQFTLYGDLRRGLRPGFERAAPPEHAEPVYLSLRDMLRAEVPVETGVFGAHMDVALHNDGPATFWIDSRDR
ncbi:MAG TPA: D-aminoacyl-tRNA deacylase [Alkalispirochaeta sp.]|nr:D-aminoacyl-tRNA deacylase [Alkalispirochaeta sp.]